jgi:hypothetical protein
MLNDSWAGRNPTRAVVPIEEEEYNNRITILAGHCNDSYLGWRQAANSSIPGTVPEEGKALMAQFSLAERCEATNTKLKEGINAK